MAPSDSFLWFRLLFFFLLFFLPDHKIIVNEWHGHLNLPNHMSTPMSTPMSDISSAHISSSTSLPSTTDMEGWTSTSNSTTSSHIHLPSSTNHSGNTVDLCSPTGQSSIDLCSPSDTSDAAALLKYVRHMKKTTSQQKKIKLLLG
ncbi:hypothetical protein DAPPUDRAFT_119926 [Daphnia pulex]|uniref:Uncharacterized protein n=1 Tax=Daphnia pulex TaxID=6669 RepID=E9HZV3_DAPPU|nr:hypothetical protein DAPPUDRAFT_119926 [Daphnia pulex]|eukprot:EFX62727.1 hypothetical protein DAPPUDRAFT_119926 [Daphnia pulex]